MSTSQSHEADLELELRVMRLLDSLAAQSPTQTVTVSSVAATLNEPGARVRPVLSRLALRRVLRAKIVMECSICGTEDDEDPSAKRAERFCATCGDDRVHEPVVIFELGDALRRAAQSARSDPKRTRRKQEPTLLRRRYLSRFPHRPATTA